VTYFQNLRNIVDTLEADESTRNDPIKRSFVIQGKHLTGNVGIVRESGNALHTQAVHDEVLVIIEGGVRFQVGDEIKTVEEGDLVFIPEGMLHGPILEEGQQFSALSVFGPHFDPTKKNIHWDRDS
jgi:quercetin dioxygenase-like cupin family protein